MRAFAALLIAGVLVAGCGGKQRDDRDAGGGGGTGVISIDAAVDVVPPTTAPDGATDRPVPIDTAPDPSSDGGPAITGHRSFAVTSLLQQDGGASTGPTSHAFTLVIYDDLRTLIAGGSGPSAVVAFESTSGAFHVIGPLTFSLSVGCAGSVTYSDLTFTIDGNGNLTGTGSGVMTIVSGDVSAAVNVTMQVAGRSDTEAPRLTISAAGDIADPFTAFSVVPSEPLPIGARPVLVSAGGDTIPLSRASTSTILESWFWKPARLLRYGEAYHVAVTGISDFAGNAAIESVSFQTVGAPPFAPQDGFESLTATTLGGAQVLSGTDAPTINGLRSLYVPPLSFSGELPPTTQLALRLAVAPGDSAIRFSYRIVNPSVRTAGTIVAAIVGDTIATLPLPADGAGTGTPAMIGSTAVILGPIQTAAMTLPPAETHEIVFARIAHGGSCGSRPMPPIQGIIIDDLRVE